MFAGAMALMTHVPPMPIYTMHAAKQKQKKDLLIIFLYRNVQAQGALHEILR